MAHSLRVSGKRLQMLLLAALLFLAFLTIINSPKAEAADFCDGVAIPHLGVCHGPWASAAFLDGEMIGTDYAVCLTMRGYSGGYYNIYEWHCGDGFTEYEFGRTEGYPSGENPNSATLTFGGDYY